MFIYPSIHQLIDVCMHFNDLLCRVEDGALLEYCIEHATCKGNVISVGSLKRILQKLCKRKTS